MTHRYTDHDTPPGLRHSVLDGQPRREENESRPSHHGPGSKTYDKAMMGVGGVWVYTFFSQITPKSSLEWDAFCTAGTAAGSAMIVFGASRAFLDAKISGARKLAIAGAFVGAALGAGQIATQAGEARHIDALPKTSVDQLANKFGNEAAARICADVLNTRKPVIVNGEEFTVQCPAPAVAGPR